jgi:hypothetical protein
MTRIIDAFRGLADIFAGRPGWREHFELTRRGLLVALAVYLAVNLVVIVVLSIARGQGPSLIGLAFAAVFFVLWAAGLGFAIMLTRISIGIKTPVLDTVVPCLYALAVAGAAVQVASLLGTFTWAPVLGILGYVLFRAGRVTAGLGIPTSVAFAVLSIVLLVGVPLSLYILTQSPGGPI